MKLIQTDIECNGLKEILIYIPSDKLDETTPYYINGRLYSNHGTIRCSYRIFFNMPTINLQFSTPWYYWKATQAPMDVARMELSEYIDKLEDSFKEMALGIVENRDWNHDET